MQERVLQYVARLVPYLTLAVVLATSFMAAKVTWALVSPMPSITVQKISTASVRNNNRKGQAQSQLHTRQLFGRFVKEEVKKEQPKVTGPVTETRLSFQLQGVFAASNDNGFAVIARSKGAKGEFFKINDNVFGQATLAQVLKDRVILNRNGRMEALKFDEGPTRGTSTIKVNKSVANAETKPRTNGRTLNMSGSVDSVIDSMREQARTDPAGLVRQMGLEATGQGYRVTRKARQLMAMGLKAGDMIISVNDMPVGDVSNDQLLVDQVLGSGEVKVEIQRGSRRFTIYPPMP